MEETEHSNTVGGKVNWNRHRGDYDKEDSVLLAWLEPDIACDSVPGRMATGLTCAGSVSL